MACANVVERSSAAAIFFFYIFFCRTSAITSAGSAQTWPRRFISIHGPRYEQPAVLRDNGSARLAIFLFFYFFFLHLSSALPFRSESGICHILATRPRPHPLASLFLLTPENSTGRTCHLEPSESTELMTSVTKYAVFFFFFFCCSLMCFRTPSDVINRRESGTGPRFMETFFSFFLS